jgi:hypothetical protein
MSAAKTMRNILIVIKNESMDDEHPVLQVQYDDGHDGEAHKPTSSFK